MECNLTLPEFIKFLEAELAISPRELAVVMPRLQSLRAPLPMLLWQYGLVSLEQLQRIFDWLDDRAPFSYIP